MLVGYLGDHLVKNGTFKNPECYNKHDRNYCNFKYSSTHLEERKIVSYVVIVVDQPVSYLEFLPFILSFSIKISLIEFKSRSIILQMIGLQPVGLVKNISIFFFMYNRST